MTKRKDRPGAVVRVSLALPPLFLLLELFVADCAARDLRCLVVGVPAPWICERECWTAAGAGALALAVVLAVAEVGGGGEEVGTGDLDLAAKAESESRVAAMTACDRASFAKSNEIQSNGIQSNPIPCDVSEFSLENPFLGGGNVLTNAETGGTPVR
jgi:hypothetical protein